MLKAAVAVVVLAILAYSIVQYAIWIGLFQRIYNHAPGPCRKLTGIEFGSEDIQVLSSGLAFISSGVRPKDDVTYNSRPGRIYLFDFNKPQVPPQPLNIKMADSKMEFISPHGISVWTDKKTATVYLYVISHIGGFGKNEVVDKFRFDASKKTLVHLRRIEKDPNFHVINDLTVVGEDQFYYTNYIYVNDLLEMGFGLHWGSVGFYDGKTSSLVDTGLFVPNGLVASPNGRLLYVAQSAAEDVRVYRRHENNSITFLHSIKLWTKVDNLDIDVKTGDLWIGAHPVAHKVVAYLYNPTLDSPSQVLRVKLTDDGQAHKVEEIYSDDGRELSASSVAIRYGKAILIGSVTSHTLYCELLTAN